MTTSRALFSTILLALAGCANQTSPEGGPKDLRPPRLLRSDPAHNQTNFKGQTIELTFNELIKLKDPQEEIVIVPSVGKGTQFKVKGTKLLITPKTKWADSTTYSINFREGVQDVTESNIAQNLQLAFSTGPDIDTLKVSGLVKDVFKEEPPEKITVALYSADTFNIFNHEAIYFTRSLKNGSFTLSNLKAGTYTLYAFDDKNKNRKVDSRNEKYGFLPERLVLNHDNIDSLELYLYLVDSRPLRLASTRALAEVNTIRFNKPIESYTLAGKQKSVHFLANDPSEITAYYLGKPDSLSYHLTATDTLGQKVDTTIYLKRDKRKKIQEKFTINIGDPVFVKEEKQLTATINFSKPIIRINPDSIVIRPDTATSYPLPEKALQYDSAKRLAKINWVLADSLPAKTKIFFRPTAFVSIDNDTSKADSKPIEELNLENTGLLTFDIQTKEPAFICELLNSNGTVAATFANQRKYTFKYLPPETYRLRVIIDTNKNGKWDCANILTNTPAERVIYYKGTNKKGDITMRANWEQGPLLFVF